MVTAYFLVGANVKPTFVDPLAMISIGRGKNNAVVLPSHYVSRQHASIKCSNDSFQLQDLESTNGTFVNNKKVEKHQLHLGDKIRIGSFVLNFLDKKTLIDEYSNLPEIATLDELATTEIKRNKGSQSDLMGKLSYLSPVELVQIINMGKKTGTLSVIGENGTEAILSVRQGEILSAQFTREKKATDGEQAVYQMLKMQNGNFVFKFREQEDGKKLSMSTMNLLMEGCRLIDEGQV